MVQPEQCRCYAVLVLLVFFMTGCKLSSPGHECATTVCRQNSSTVIIVDPNSVACVPPATSSCCSQSGPTILAVSHQIPVDTVPAIPEPADPAVNRSIDPCDPFANQAGLSMEQLIVEVQARNPSLQAASAAWRAATQRYPQATSLDDPMFASMIGPRGVGMDNGGGWMVQASQKIPWAGKLALRGDAASAEADAMKGDIGEVRLRLSEATKTAFYDYYLARREKELNDSTRRLVKQFQQIAWDKYQVNQTTQQDGLQADVELATLETRATELERDGQVAIARINTLLHRSADHPLPPPPMNLPLLNSLPTTETLQQTALLRPDLFAMQARIRTEEANLALACKEYYPDLNVVAKYDGFMPEEMRPQVGLEFNIPLQQGRRSAAVCEGWERLRQRRAEYQDRLDQVRYEVQSAVSRVAQGDQAIHLYEEKILPAVQRSVESAQSNYVSGNLDFLRLIDAERQVYVQQTMYQQTLVEYHRRLAELERAVGGTLFP